MTQEEFIAILDEKGYSYKIENEKLIVDYNGYVDFSDIKKLPKGIVFKNKNDIWFESLEVLPSDVVFENGGAVYLDNIKVLPGGVIFENGGRVELNGVEKLPNGIRFKNEDFGWFSEIEWKVNYQGLELNLQNIDGYTMVIDSEEKSGEYTIYKARYFQSGKYEEMPQCFVATKAKRKAGIGVVIEEAIEELEETIKKDMKLAKEIKERGILSGEEYRLLKGQGDSEEQRLRSFQRFAESVMPIDEVLKLTKDNYFRELFN